MARCFLDVDPRELRLPPERNSGADPHKLQVQIARFGASMVGMPAPIVYRTLDDLLMLWDGVTRATRVAKLCPGQLVQVELVGTIAVIGRKYPSVGDCIP